MGRDSSAGTVQQETQRRPIAETKELNLSNVAEMVPSTKRHDFLLFAAEKSLNNLFAASRKEHGIHSPLHK